MALSTDSELIDILDPAGNPLNYTASRTEVHQKGLWHRTVHIWVFNNRKELLLQKRSAAKESFPSLWDISAAGHITAGDSSRRAGVRELEEELGIKAREEELEFLFTIKGFYVNAKQPFFDHEFSDVYLLRTVLTIDQMAFGRDEIDEIRYMGIEELKRDLAMRPELYVPHHEAYGRLFGYLG
jgi:isopentenyl-diphosphate delta-isomerase type 1